MRIPFIPLRKTTLKTPPLPVAMSGVRRGERVLQIGIDDPAIAGAIAAIVGVNGRAAFAVTGERAAAAARKAAENAMALADVEIAALPRLPFDEESFDLVVLNARKTADGLDAATLLLLLREAHRVLRDGGRIVAMQPGTAAGLTAWLRPSKPAAPAGGLASGLDQAGFRGVRVLADREGYLFTEGLRSKG
jgi:SAM-dependent methyltransferase